MNIALKKPAYQSSTDSPVDKCEARFAVDGDRGTNWSQDPCSHTDNDPQAWWAVDLGQVYMLDYVTLTNRGGQYGKWS